MTVWDDMRLDPFIHTAFINLYPDAMSNLNDAIREMNEEIEFHEEWNVWERKHSIPRRFRKPKRRTTHAHEKFNGLRHLWDGYADSPRSTLRSRRGELCPPIPTDYEQARIEAILEEFGWPIEQDDTHPDRALTRKLEQQRKELNVLYDDYMTVANLGWERERARQDLEDWGPDYVIEEDLRDDDEEAGWRDDDYDDFEYESWRRRSDSGL